MKNSFLETIKIFDGEVYNISYHQKRYENVLRSLGKTEFHTLSTYINPSEDGLYRCRLIYTLSNTIEVSYHSYTKRNIKSLKIIEDNTLNYSQKALNRDELTALYERRADCDDILITQNGLITDTSIANIAFYNGLDWLTPKMPLLKGTTRARYLQEKKIIESDIKVSDIEKFSKVALLNAMIDFDIITDISFIH